MERWEWHLKRASEHAVDSRVDITGKGVSCGYDCLERRQSAIAKLVVDGSQLSASLIVVLGFGISVGR